MADKTKVTTKVNSFEDVQRSLQEVEKSINQISDSVNVKAEGQVGDVKGKTGDIRTTQNSDKTFTFEVRTSSGWKAPYLGDSSIKFKDKESSFSQNQKKSIDELEVEDTSRGTTQAKHITYDEKADKFILPRPDYDSGWVAMSDTDTTGTHSLESVPIMAVWHISNDNGVTIQQGPPAMDNDDNCALQYTNSVWRLYGNNNYGHWGNGGDSHTAIDYTGFKLRVLLWK